MDNALIDLVYFFVISVLISIIPALFSDTKIGYVQYCFPLLSSSCNAIKHACFADGHSTTFQ